MTDLDEAGLARLSQATSDALAAVGAAVQRLATVETSGESPDRRIRVRVTGLGRVTELWLRDGVLRRYDNAALGDLVTRTIRDTQRRARAAYDRAVGEFDPPEVAANNEELRRLWRN